MSQTGKTTGFSSFGLKANVIGKEVVSGDYSQSGLSVVSVSMILDLSSAWDEATMWRNSIGFSSKLLISHTSNPSSSISSAANGVVRPLLLSHSHSHPRSSSSSSESLKLGFPRSDGILPSKATEALDFARYYGRCYWELSKARLR